MSQATHQANIQSVVDLILGRLEPDRRTIIAIAGPPASGKTTLTEAVVEHLNKRAESAPSLKASVLPMDGFHLGNDVLDELGLRHRKGAVETFDETAFCTALSDLSQSQDERLLPGFDRSQDRVVPGKIQVEASTRIIVTEGNYLLLNRSPWREARDLYAATVFVTAPLDVLKMRLIERWLDQGLSAQEAQSKVMNNDLPNAAMVLIQSQHADLVIEHHVHDTLAGAL